ncbi:PepSY domain-containing protein [Allohahella marinimesophila]
MTNNLKGIVLATVCSTALLGATTALADKEDREALAAAKISLVEAIQAAEGANGGKAFDASIDDDSFEPEYEVSIIRDDRTYDVRVNAVSGEVIGEREDHDD